MNSIESLHRIIEDQEMLDPRQVPKYRIGEKLYLEVEVVDSVSANGLNYWLYGLEGKLTPMGLKLNKVNHERSDLTKMELEKLNNVISDILYN